MTANDQFLRLEDLLLPLPLPPLVSILLVLGFLFLGRVPLRLLAIEAATFTDRAAAFLLSVAVISAVLHALAVAGLASLVVMRGLGTVIGVLGVVQLRRLWRGRGVHLSALRESFAALPGSLKVLFLIETLALAGLLAGALGPVTDIDSLNYHLGVPLEWIRHEGAVPRPDWLHARLVGLGEMINMLGLAMGTDSLGASFQAAGLCMLLMAFTAVAGSSRDRALAVALVVGCPVMVFLVLSQKPQLLPAAATTVALLIFVMRYRRLDNASVFLALGCVAFAMACKYSFMISGVVVMAVGLAASRRSKRTGTFVLLGCLLTAVLAGPVLARNFFYYGDPLSPMLERWRDAGDPAVVTFAWYLRNFGGVHSFSEIARLPVEFTVPLHPGALTTVLGLGSLAFVFAGHRRSEVRLLLIAAATAALLLALLSQLSARFFLEPYLWAAATALYSAWTPLKRLFLKALGVQLLLVLVMSAYAGITLFPAALVPHLRDRVMTVAAEGYAVAKWLDRTLPQRCVVMAETRSNALLPRPFVSYEVAMFLSISRMTAENRTAILHDQVRRRGVDVIVMTVPEEGSIYFPLRSVYGKRLGPPGRFVSTARNPWRRGPVYELQAVEVKASDADPSVAR